MPVAGPDTAPTSSLGKGVRSTRGCFTCRRRKKKCDEQFNSVGWCRACVRGRYLCSGRPASGSVDSTRPPYSSHPINAISLALQPTSLTIPEPHKVGETFPWLEALLGTDALFPTSAPTPQRSNQPPLTSDLSVSNVHLSYQAPTYLAAQPAPAATDHSSSRSSTTQRPPSSAAPTPHHSSSCPIDSHQDGERLYRTPGPGWTDLVQKYQEFNRGFIRYLPKPVRLQVMEYMSDIAATNDLGRSAGSAVALIPYWDRPNDDDDEDDSASRDQDMVDKAVSAIMQAKTLLGDLPNSLEASLAALLDMYYYEFWQNGARAAFSIHDVMCATIAGRTDAERRIDLRVMANPSDFALHAVVCIDIMASACLPNRRPLFTIVDSPDMPSDEADDTQDYIANTFLGLPVTVLRCFAAISNLRSDLGTIASSVVHARAQAIEQELVDWVPQPLDREASSPESPLEYLAVQEMWRYAAIIYLYQVVHRSGCLSLVMRNAVTEILNYGRLLHPRSSDSASLDFVSACLRACPWMFAASVAINQDDRDACRTGLQRCGSAQAFKDDLVIAEMIWDLMDTTGFQVDWRNLSDLPGQFPILI